ncbi:glycoside hydrolase family 3 protein [Deinococcus aquaticus]|uniref:beta-glucosidase n=1 Tax=Deinococcus aquaticus TaxID=328692 RepID=A0ABY7UY39_9DEIO|nr:glycoside hydrolase family 3 N-terminal domain-containing protein [Deinococcus aquaticus]WDA57828.1 glycoside hydrolase family 3 C-terminal domain-containing protein [Deinococcus aquaticus]
MIRKSVLLPTACLLPTAVLLLSTALAATPFTTGAPAANAPYRNAALPVDARVNDLLLHMTLDEKIGQMTQAERAAIRDLNDMAVFGIGSVLSGGGSGPADNTPPGWAAMVDAFQAAALRSRLGIPMLYGADAVHGHNNVPGATLFPHNIGLGAAGDPDLARRIGRATAEEMTGTGVRWNFSPCLCVVRDVRWGRTYESFGETPALPVALSTIIDGYQGAGGPAQPGAVLATAKHYLGDGGTTFGSSATEGYLLDQGDTRLSEAELRRVHLPPFRAAVARNVGSVMVSFSGWNGTKLHADRYLITDVLKKELGFTGLVISDWAGVDQIPGGYPVAVRTAINAGIDMVMVPNDYVRFVDTLSAEVRAGRVPMSRIDDAVTRILRQKFRLGLFERPMTDASFQRTFGSAEHRALAREAVQKSLVLLRNDGVLPLRPGARLFVAGQSADDVGRQSGGWTLTWQGQNGPVPGGTSLLAGLREAGEAGGGSVTYARAAQPGQARDADVGLVVVGETPYAEGKGDRASLALNAEDTANIRTVCADGPCVVVTVSGRPLILPGTPMNALVAAWLPGSEGAGVADVLYGRAPFTGRLPVSWPRRDDQLPLNADTRPYDPLFPAGFGLTTRP